MGQPGDRVALAATGGVLDQIAAAGAVLSGISEQATHHLELVEAGPDLHRLLPAGLLVLGLHHLGVVLKDVGEPLAGEDLLPEVGRLEALRVRGVAGAVVPTLVEGQEPGGFAFELGAEAHLMVVHGEMGHAAAELEQLLARVAVELVLLHGVSNRLFGEAVLELKGGHRQAIDEQAQIQSSLGFIAAVAELTGHAEAVGGEALDRCGVPW